MLSKISSFICPVCGYPDLDEAAYDSYGCATYNICPCCGTEFGYDDSEISHFSLRQRWITNGMKWWSEHLPPPDNWSPIQQLKDAGMVD